MHNIKFLNTLFKNYNLNWEVKEMQRLNETTEGFLLFKPRKEKDFLKIKKINKKVREKRHKEMRKVGVKYSDVTWCLCVKENSRIDGAQINQDFFKTNHSEASLRGWEGWNLGVGVEPSALIRELSLVPLLPLLVGPTKITTWALRVVLARRKDLRDGVRLILSPFFFFESL